MVSQFKSKSSSSVIWITLLGIFVHLPFIFQGPEVVILPGSPLLSKILVPFQSFSSFVLFVFYLLLIILQASRLNVAANNLSLFPKENSLSGMAYILFTALLPEWNNISGSLIINTLLIEMLATFRLLHTSEKPEKLIFNLSICMGLAIMFYPPSIVWALLLFLALAVLCQFKMRLILVWLIGIIVPYYFLATYLFLTDKIIQIRTYIPHFDLHPFVMKEKPIVYILAFGFILLSVIIGILSGQQNSGKLVISARKIWGVISFIFFVAIGVYFVFNDAMKSVLFFATVPAALLSANTFFYSNKKWVSGFWFWLIVAGIFCTNLISLNIIKFKF